MPDQSYLDLDVTITPSLGRQGYAVKATAADLGQYAGTFNLPFPESDLEDLRNGLLEPPDPDPQPGADQVQAQAARDARRIQFARARSSQRLRDRVVSLGGRLFDELFRGEIRDCLNLSVNRAESTQMSVRIRLWLDEAPELAGLPWEYLHQRAPDTGYLGLARTRSIVRYMQLPKPITGLLVRPPLRMLVARAIPKDLRWLDAEQEWQSIAETLKPFVDSKQVELTLLSHATRTTLLDDLKRTRPHVLHFIGHGDFETDDEGLTPTNGAATSNGATPGARPVLILEKDDGTRDPVDLDPLKVILSHQQLRLVILNSCQSARADHMDPLNGIAQGLTNALLPAVIAMQYRITDRAAKEFTRTFYKELVDDSPVDAALVEARVSIYTNTNSVEWGTPVLFMRTSDGRLFKFNRPTAEQQRRERVDLLHAEVLEAVNRREYAIAQARLAEILKLQDPGPDPGN